PASATPPAPTPPTPPPNPPRDRPPAPPPPPSEDMAPEPEPSPLARTPPTGEDIWPIIDCAGANAVCADDIICDVIGIAWEAYCCGIIPAWDWSCCTMAGSLIVCCACWAIAS